MTAAAAPRDPRPCIVHVVYRLDVGGLENGLVNLINHMPADAYRHAIISLTDITQFHRRIARDDVALHALHKGPGHAVRLYPRLYRLFRQMAPAIVHTRNLAALEATVPARLAGVPVRIHGEHGRSVEDLDGSNVRLRRVRRLYRPFVTHYVALSSDLARDLRSGVGVPKERVTQIYNGVDTGRFRPASDARKPTDCPFGAGTWMIGWAGRMEAVKDPVLLARAFVLLAQRHPRGAAARLIMVGDGSVRADVEAVLDQAGMRERAWLPGERADVADILRTLDCFALPSRGEGISNTVLEAMASGVPVVATRVGGNAELVEQDVTGTLVAPGDAEALANAIAFYLGDPAAARRHGAAGRERAVERFSLERMVSSYRALYDGLLRGRHATSSTLAGSHPGIL